MNKNWSRRTRPLLLVSLFLSLANLRAQVEAPGDGTESHEIEKGYASSYLPLQQGPLVNNKYRYDQGLIMDEEMSLAERFDRARREVLAGNGREEFIPLYDFLKDVGHDPKAQGWEGKCHQWSGAASDKNVKALVNNTKGLLCEGIILEQRDLKELFTGLYPARIASLYGKRESVPPGMDKDIYEMNLFLRSFQGKTDFSPQLFHERAHSLLQSGQGFVLDMDPGEQVWNHPVYKVSSKSKLYEGQVPKDDFPLIPLEYLEPASEEAKVALQNLGEVNAALEIILASQDKRKDTLVLPMLERAGMASAAMRDLIAEKDKGDLNEVVSTLVMKKYETFQKALASGVKISAPYRVRVVETTVDYLVETSFRQEGTPGAQKTFLYFFVEEGSVDAPHVVKSQWLDFFLSGNGQPDFLWVPECSSETCHLKAESFKRSRLFQSMSRAQRIEREEVGLLIGLSDLLKLFKECYPLDQGIRLTQEFMDSINQIKGRWALAEKSRREEGTEIAVTKVLDEGDRALLMKQFQLIRESKIPLKMSSLNPLLSDLPGVRIDQATGQLVME